MSKTGLSDIIGYMMNVSDEMGEFDDLTITVKLAGQKLRVRKNHKGLTMTIADTKEKPWIEPDGY